MLEDNFDSYYIVRTDEGQPRPKYIFNKCGTNVELTSSFLLYRGLVHHHQRLLKVSDIVGALNYSWEYIY